MTGSAVDGALSRDDHRVVGCSAQRTNWTDLQFREGGINVEVENRGGSRTSLRRGRSYLGLCATKPGARVLRTACLHRTAGQERRAGGTVRKPDGGDLCAARDHQCGLLDSPAK